MVGDTPARGERRETGRNHTGETPLVFSLLLLLYRFGSFLGVCVLEKGAGITRLVAAQDEAVWERDVSARLEANDGVGRIFWRGRYPFSPIGMLNVFIWGWGRGGLGRKKTFLLQHIAIQILLGVRMILE